MTGHSQVRFALNRLQQFKLRRLLLDAASNVPLYQALYEPLGLSNRELADPGVLCQLPILTKSMLLATGDEKRVNRRFKKESLIRESTTGSTGQPFSVLYDRRYLVLRNLRFLRGLLSVGFRPWHRMLLLTDRHPGFSRRTGWYYQSVERPTTEIVEAYRRVRPEVLYGFTTPLRLLAESLSRNSGYQSGPRLVVSTAEMLDAATRQTLEKTFGCPVADFYGMTEMGLVAWQRAGEASYTMAHSSVLTELLPDQDCPGRYRMLMTNLDLRATPIIRFDCGDLAFAEMANGRPVIRAFEGRQIDAIARRDGTTLSPYVVTDALRDVPGLRRFKVTQCELTRFEIAGEIAPSLRDEATRSITAVFEHMLGTGLELEFSFTDNLVPDSATKFRPVESRLVHL